MTNPLADRLIEAQRQRQARLASRGVAAREDERATDSALAVDAASAQEIAGTEVSRTDANPDSPARGAVEESASDASPALDPGRVDSRETDETGEIGELRRVVTELLGEWGGLAESISSLKADLLYRDAIEALCDGDAASLHRALAPLHAELRAGDGTSASPEEEAQAEPVEANATKDEAESSSRAVAAVVSSEASKLSERSSESAPSAEVLAKLNEMLALLGEHLRTNAGAARELDPRSLTEEIAREVVGKVREAVRRDVARELDSRGSDRGASPEPRRSKLLRFGSTSRERAKTETPADAGAPRVSLDDVPALIDMLTHPK